MKLLRYRFFFKQTANSQRIPLTFAPEEPNSESLEAIREGDAFLASGKIGRFDNGADLVVAAMEQFVMLIGHLKFISI